MITYSNKDNVSIGLAVWLVTNEYRGIKNLKEFSATTLMNSPRYIIGEKRKYFPEEFPDLVEEVDGNLMELLQPDIQDKAAIRIGNAIHSSVENAWITKESRELALRLLGYPETTIEKVLVNPEPEDIKPDSLTVYTEKTFTKPYSVNGEDFIISGQADLIIEGQLHDIKTTSTYVVETGVKDEDYILQGSIYRWLNPEIITGDTITIDFVLKNWTSNRTFEDNYPKSQIMSKSYKLLSIAETESFIRNKLKLVQKHWKDPLKMIPCCSKEEIFREDSIFKYFSKGYIEGKRATKNFSTLTAASNYRATKGGYQGDIVEFKGMPFTCPYCDSQEIEEYSKPRILTSNLNIG